jgi:hypothetical protein
MLVPICGTYTARVNDASSEPVSLGKSGAGGSSTPNAPGASNGAPGSPKKPAPPRMVLFAVIALGISGLAAVLSSVALYSQDAWLFRELTKSNAKLKKSKQLSVSELHDKVGQTQKTALIGALIVVLAVAILGYAVYRGRYWARWGVIGFWVLATFSGTVIGINSILAIAGDIPGAYKVPSFLAGATFAIAVVLVNLRDSTQYFALSRPVRPAGAPQRRGLFGPRPAPAPRGVPAPAPARAAADRGAAADRSRAKKRANVVAAESVAKGADLARTRAKASKSRRTET